MATTPLKEQYDVIIIGSGAGGGTLAYGLSQYGKSVLLIERGTFLPQEDDNWSTEGVGGQKYRTPVEMVIGEQHCQTYTHAYVGGQTKLYGAALYRLRREDFEELVHAEGISPEWPISYDELEPFYTKAEKLYKVHGSTKEDSTEPFHSEPYQHLPLQHERFIQPLVRKLTKQGLNVSYIPKAIDYGDGGNCVFCGTCDGYACRVNGKLDTEIACIRPALSTGYVDLMTHAECKRLITDDNGKEITGVQVDVDGEAKTLKAKIYVASCGVLETPALFFRSATDRYPNGLANSSGELGRNLAGHNTAVFIVPTFKKIPEIHQKTFAVNDFYLRGPRFNYPMGLLQAAGRLPIWLEVEDWLCLITKFIAKRSIIAFIMSEALPKHDNHVCLTEEGKIQVKCEPNNIRAFRKLRMAFMRAFWKAGYLGAVCSRHPGGGIPWHPVGTLRFGSDPKTSVLNTWCQTHDISNLYVVDSSFMPTAGAVNTALTVMAQALRVAGHINKRL